MFRNSIILFGIMLSSSVLADTASKMPCGSRFLVGLSGGPTWVTGNQGQTFNLQPDVKKTYTADNNRSEYFPTGEIFIGWQMPLVVPMVKQSILSQLGIVVAAAGNAKLTGDILEDADPEFNNFNYQYKVNHTHVAIQGRLIGSNCGCILEPYISGSVGVGFNHAYNFSIHPKIVEEVPAPPFNSNTTTTFIYTLGVGLQTSFNTHLQAAVGYEFADWGKTQLARANGQTQNQGITQSHLYAHQLQLSLFYIC